MPKRNILPALFDVKPKKGLGTFVVQREINLRPPKIEQPKPVAKPTVSKIPEPRYVDAPIITPPHTIRPSVREQIFAHAPRASERDIIAHEVESALAEEHLVADLVRAGATVHEQVRQIKPMRPRATAVIKAEPSAQTDTSMVLPEPAPAPVKVDAIRPAETRIPAPAEDNRKLEEFWSNGGQATLARASFEPVYTNPFPVSALPSPLTHLSPAARNVEVLLEQMTHQKPIKIKKGRKWFTRRKAIISVLLIAIIGVGGFTISTIQAGGYVAKQNILQNGSNALANLEEAKQDLEDFDFSRAAENFALANDDFEKASGTLSNFGASMVSLFGNFPGFSKVKSASNLVQSGKYIAKAGENLSLAVSGLYKTNFFALVSGAPTGGRSLLSEFQDFRGSLVYAGKNIDKAGSLLQDIDIASIPDDKQHLFVTFKDKIPDFQAYIRKAVEYSDFLLGIIGEDKPTTYMVLLQNTSERRPTGGFPGTYAIISFDRGRMKKIFVDDIYNPDGQIRENIIPPGPLRHITPNWGMRDANWFADFPASAQKIEQFYLLDGGARLDGVFAIDPTLIARILDLIGPIEMPEYGVTLDANNFLAQIQDEVEYKAARKQPKQIVMDFQPRFFEKLASQDASRWKQIMEIILESFEQKHILAYFNDPVLQREVLQDGFGGEIKERPGSDYLQVAIANVAGSKSDAVTANSLRLSTLFDSGIVRHELSITRAHNGGKSEYAFYNKESPAYIKVYVPQGSVLDTVQGNSLPTYKPLISYVDLGFKHDPALLAIENTMTQPFTGVDVFEESGKTVFGFWMIIKPQKTMNVTVQYHVPAGILGLNDADYTMYWQKQSGNDGDLIHFGAQIPDGATLVTRSSNVQVIGNSIALDTDLSLDREIKFTYR